MQIPATLFAFEVVSVSKGIISLGGARYLHAVVWISSLSDTVSYDELFRK